MFIKSDSFKNDGYGWVTNQCGHAWIGPVCMLPLLGLGCPLIPALFVTWLAYFVIIEVIDQRLELKRDAISDSLHVLFGAWIVGVLPNYGQALLIMAGWGLVLAYGYWRRT